MGRLPSGGMDSTDNYQFKFDVPKSDELSNRFFDINAALKVRVDYSGYVREIDCRAPYNGPVSIKNIINILNRDINVIIPKEYIIQLRNSVIYYNEYFCKSEENITGSEPAYIAFERLEQQYKSIFGETIVSIQDNQTNIFKVDVLDGIVDYTRDITPDDIDEYMRKHKRGEIKISSSNGSYKAVPKVEESLKTIHERYCEKLPTMVNINNFGMHHDDIDFE